MLRDGAARGDRAGGCGRGSEKALALCDEIREFSGHTESNRIRLWAGLSEVEVLLGAGLKERAQERLRAHEELVATCQSPYQSR